MNLNLNELALSSRCLSCENKEAYLKDLKLSNNHLMVTNNILKNQVEKNNLQTYNLKAIIKSHDLDL
jgi:DNA-directed RNA polymerase alpha subunit